jgi:hypothetical protein
MRLSALLLVAACGNDVALTQDAKCDGQAQPGEDPVDSPFDQDGDGFFDANNPACAATYPPGRLDCADGDAEVNPEIAEVTCNGKDDDCSDLTTDNVDVDGDGASACLEVDCADDDAAVNPSAEEVCGNGLDDDCDGSVDPDCEIDYSGTYTLDQQILYDCGYFYGFQMVSIHFGTVTVTDQQTAISFQAVGSSQPGRMSGTKTGNGFFADHTLTGDCDESYSITGSFTDADHFTGTFTADYSGGLCLDCTQQTWTITGSK